MPIPTSSSPVGGTAWRRRARIGIEPTVEADPGRGGQRDELGGGVGVERGWLLDEHGKPGGGGTSGIGDVCACGRRENDGVEVGVVDHALGVRERRDPVDAVSRGLRRELRATGRVGIGGGDEVHSPTQRHRREVAHLGEPSASDEAEGERAIGHAAGFSAVPSGTIDGVAVIDIALRWDRASSATARPTGTAAIDTR